MLQVCGVTKLNSVNYQVWICHQINPTVLRKCIFLVLPFHLKPQIHFSTFAPQKWIFDNVGSLCQDILGNARNLRRFGEQNQPFEELFVGQVTTQSMDTGVWVSQQRRWKWSCGTWLGWQHGRGGNWGLPEGTLAKLPSLKIYNKVDNWIIL